MRTRVHESVLDLHVRAHRFEAAQVHVDLATADRVAARQCDPGLATTGEERTEHVERRAHLRHELVRRLGTQLTGRVDAHLVPGQQLDFGAERAQQLGHHFEVAHHGHVAQCRHARREQRGRHLFGAGVLRRTGDLDPAVERSARPDAEGRHDPL